MKSSVGNKILIVFVVLLTFSFFIRLMRFILPMILIAIAIGFLWDWLDGKEKDKYDNY